MKKIMLALLMSSSMVSVAWAEEALSSGNDFSKGATAYELDYMLDTFKSASKGKVEITLFKKVSFDADILAMPEVRKSAYMQQLLDDLVPAKITVSEGMMVRSKQGKAYNLYVLDELLEQITNDLKVGDQVTFYGYHAYSSFYGPGLLMYAYDTKAGVAH